MNHTTELLINIGFNFAFVVLAIAVLLSACVWGWKAIKRNKSVDPWENQECFDVLHTNKKPLYIRDFTDQELADVITSLRKPTEGDWDK